MKTFLVLLLLILVLTSCSSEVQSVTGNVTSVQFIARSWKTRDLIQVTFDDGTILFISPVYSPSLKVGHQYLIKYKISPSGSIIIISVVEVK